MTHKMIGGTQVGRKHEANQDRVLLRKMELAWSDKPLFLIAVADGVSQGRFGGKVARWLIEDHLQTDTIFLHPQKPLWEQLQSYLEGLHPLWCQEWQEDEDILNSASTLSLAACHQDQADSLWVGDSPISLSVVAEKGFRTSRLTSPDIDARGALTHRFDGGSFFQLKHQHVIMPPQAILTITSDGVSWEEVHLSEAYQRLGFSHAVVEEVLQEATQGEFSDDCSLVACQRSVE